MVCRLVLWTGTCKPSLMLCDRLPGCSSFNLSVGLRKIQGVQHKKTSPAIPSRLEQPLTCPSLHVLKAYMFFGNLTDLLPYSYILV